MFQLIVAVISIAMVMALLLASIFFGGEAFTKAEERARLAKDKPAISKNVEPDTSTGLNRLWTTKEAF